MASITNRADGSSFLQFVLDGKRHTVNMGGLSGERAARFKANVEALVRSKKYGLDLSDQLAEWLHKLDDRVHETLARTGLVASRVKIDVPTLSAWLDGFIASRTDVKPNTTKNMRLSSNRLVKHFGPDQPIDQITQGDADAFLRFLKEQGYADNTASRTIKHARQFFRAAIRAKLLTENPFGDVEAAERVGIREAPVLHNAGMGNADPRRLSGSPVAFDLRPVALRRSALPF